MPNTLAKAFVTILLACFVWLMATVVWRATQEDRVHRRERQAARIAALRADSSEAARDTTRAVLFSEQLRAAAGDSVRLFQRRIVQTRQRADSLDRALGLERAARYQVEASVKTLEAELRSRPVVEVPPAGGDSVRTGEFVLDSPPYHIDASVTLPQPPAEGRMSLKVVLDTAEFDARVGCGLPGVAGVRPATLTLAGPAWVGVRLRALEQEERVCSPEEPAAGAPRDSWLRRVTRRIHSGVGLAVTASADGRMAWGVGFGTVWSLRR